MADKAGVRVQGLSLCLRSLKKLDDSSGKRVSALNRSTAQYVVPIAKGLAPRESGDLAGSVRAGATQRQGYVIAGSSLVVYAAPIHWGWPARDIPAQPFMTEALGEAEPEIVTQYAVGFIQLVTEVGL